MVKNLHKSDLSNEVVPMRADTDAGASNIGKMGNDVGGLVTGQGDADIGLLQRDDFDRDVWCLLGLPVDIADIDQAVGKIDQAVREGHRLSFVTPNVNFLTRASRDETARSDILNADLSLIDGAPLVAMAKMLGLPVRTRVAGSDLFEALRRRPAFAGRPLRVFFFGGREGAAKKAVDVVNAEKSGIEAVGWCNPGFGDVDAMSSKEIIAQINDAVPDFVVVALGAAKGQAWIDHNQLALTAPVVAHLGAVVDFTAGGIQRAPEFVQKLGLEWAWRIKEEPSLWRRYFDDGLALLKIMVTDLLPQIGRAASLASSLPAAAELGSVELAGEAASILKLSGDLHHASLGSIRTEFRKATATGGDIVLDLTEVQSFDRAFLGLVLMLEKNSTTQGAKIYLRGANLRQIKVFQANNMGYSGIEIADEELTTSSERSSAA